MEKQKKCRCCVLNAESRQIRVAFSLEIPLKVLLVATITTILPWKKLRGPAFRRSGRVARVNKKILNKISMIYLFFHYIQMCAF